MSELNRREFVMAAAAACACTFCCGGATEVLAQEAAKAGPVDAGSVADLKQGINDKLMKSDKIVLVRDGKTVYAMTAICSHKNKALAPAGETLKCPAHGSIFALNGTVQKGPAKVSLYRYAVTVNADKHLIVDKSKQFEEKDWGKPEASAKIA